MSRIGKLPITITQGVAIERDGSKMKVTGPKGTVEFDIPRQVTVKEEDGKLIVEIKGSDKLSKALHGTVRAIIANNVKGVSEGWTKKMELVGTGFRAEVAGNLLTLTLGFSHPVKVTAPEGVNFKVEKNIISVEGADRAKVGQICAEIRRNKPPEPYKGKGILYQGEKVRRKAGKAAKATAA
jgi:large subunit ribosomal protein L6